MFFHYDFSCDTWQFLVLLENLPQTMKFPINWCYKRKEIILLNPINNIWSWLKSNSNECYPLTLMKNLCTFLLFFNSGMNCAVLVPCIPSLKYNSFNTSRLLSFCDANKNIWIISSYFGLGNYLSVYRQSEIPLALGFSKGFIRNIPVTLYFNKVKASNILHG